MIVRRPVCLSSTSIRNLIANPVAPTYGPSAEAPRTEFAAFHWAFFASTLFSPCHARPLPSTETSRGDHTFLLMSNLPLLKSATTCLPSSSAERPGPVETRFGFPGYAGVLDFRPPVLFAV